MSQTLTVDANQYRRIIACLIEWLNAPSGADIEFRLGITDFGENAIVISINGTMSGFTTTEARGVADIAEHIMRTQGTTEMADLILGLRACADAGDAR